MEMTGAATLQWLGHASFCIRHEETAIYIDPWKVTGTPRDASLVLVSHNHYDHYSAEDIGKVMGEGGELVSTADVVKAEGHGQILRPGSTVVVGVPAYNVGKAFHSKANEWLGFVIEVGAQRIYYAGDTDLTDEMKTLAHIDVALLPVGGTYTMDASEAAEAASEAGAKRAIPYHWGDIVGGRADADRFAELCACPVTVLEPGASVELSH
jgi:L-ascorbate metabolism protein UlaG (beta-lactamase superfamily)